MHRGQVGVLVANAFDLLARQMAGAIGDAKTVFRRAVDQVSGGGQVLSQLFVFGHKLQDFVRGPITVLADQAVDAGIFATGSHAAGQHNQLAAVGDCHSGAINRLVAQPGAVKFCGVQIGDHGLRHFIQDFDVDLYRQFGRLLKTFAVVPYEQPTNGEAVVGGPADDGQHVHNWQIAAEQLFGPVEDPADRRVDLAQSSFDSAGGTDKVGGVDPQWAARADEEVLVVVGHADHLVGHHLAQREDQVVATLADEPVHLGRPGLVEAAAGGLGDKGGGHFAQRDHIVAPVVLPDQRERQPGEHPIELPRLHRKVGAQGGQHVDQAVAVVMVSQAGQPAGLAGGPRKVGRHGQHALPWAQLVETMGQPRLQILVAQLGIRSSLGEIECHGGGDAIFSSEWLFAYDYSGIRVAGSG